MFIHLLVVGEWSMARVLWLYQWLSDSGLSICVIIVQVEVEVEVECNTIHY